MLGVGFLDACADFWNSVTLMLIALGLQFDGLVFLREGGNYGVILGVLIIFGVSFKKY